ncbi:MAG: alpha-mannosidase [Lentisphaeria bacterium]|nr:alpha-mannosidase [Lentisphaeria bacterium]
MLQREFDLYLDRARHFHKRLADEFFFESRPLAAEFRHSTEPVPYAERLNGDYRPISEGETWGGPWDSGWFHLTGEIPAAWAGKPVALAVNLNGEALLFDEKGVPHFGFSGGSVFGENYRKEFYQLPCEVTAGQKLEFWVEAAANSLFGMEMSAEPSLNTIYPYGNYKGIARKLRIGLFNRELWHLRLDFEILLDLINVLPPRGRRTDEIVMAMNDAANAFAENPVNAKAAREALKKVMSRPAASSAMTAAAVGHAHIDTGWLWPVRESVRKCARTFASQLRLLEQYPDYVFGASAPQHYAFVKQYYPELYEEIRAAVKGGRWELQGGMWVEADCNLISGESMVRQFLYGKNFFMDEFGVDVKNLWIPDVFGYSAAMPQIIRQSGCDYFLTQKISWSWSNKFPYHTFNWRGIDGSEVLTHFPPEDTYNASVVPGQLAAAETKFNENTILDEFMSLYGIGDGGGGPKEEYIERALRLADIEGCPKVKFDRADRFFERIAAHRDRLPTWCGELYLELHRGTLTVQARTKRNNRKLEELLATVEFANTLRPLSGYPAADLDRIWKILLINQFHDIIPGSSIRKVYETTEREHAEALAECAGLIESAVRKLGAADENALTLVNSLPVPQNDPILLPESWNGHAVLDAEGRELAVQQEGGRSIVAATVPADSIAALRRGAAKSAAVEALAAPVLENSLIRYEFDADGRLVRAFDKEANRDVLPAGAAANDFSLYVDRANNHEAWDIDIFYEQQKCGAAKGIEPPRAWKGAVRSGVEFRLGIGGSTLTQRVTLAENTKRLDFETEAEWHEERKMLRVAFPVAVFTDEASFDIQYGTVRRPTHRNTSWDAARFEVCGQKFADISEENYGAALLNDCKYGYKAFGTTLDLCLLRAPKFPDWDADQGHHLFTYAFLPHTGNLNHSNVRFEAAKLNRPAFVVPGVAANLVSPVSLEAGDVALTAVKKAEKEECLVIRLVELAGRTSKAVLSLPAGKRLVETNLLEWTEAPAPEPVGGKVELTLKPFEIKTFKVR